MTSCEFDCLADMLQNPWGSPNNIEKAAIMVFKRKSRFIDGYSIEEEINSLVNKYFGNLKDLHKNGLDKYYKEMAKEVISNNFIGLILFGADKNNIKVNNYIAEYIVNNNNYIRLTISSICQHLVTDYIKSENVEKLCKETPNFDIYYNL